MPRAKKSLLMILALVFVACESGGKPEVNKKPIFIQENSPLGYIWIQEDTPGHKSFKEAYETWMTEFESRFIRSGTDWYPAGLGAPGPSTSELDEMTARSGPNTRFFHSSSQQFYYWIVPEKR